MRIIAGDYKGRRLNTPMDNMIRPTSDKVKEALFSIIAPNLYDAKVCDLFAGTGNLGLEALSRGAEFCWFGDHAGESIKLIKENVEMCKAEEYSKIIHGDYLRVLDSMDEQADIIFLDPPFNKNLWEKAIEAISENDALAENGIIIAEHYKEHEMEESIAGFNKIKEKKYGRILLSIYAK